MSNNSLQNIDIKKVKNTLRRRAKEIKEGLTKYLELLKLMHEKKVNVSQNTDFQRRYNGFFRVQRRAAVFYDAYYEYMERHKNDKGLTFEAVLKYLHEKTRRVERSFSSKLLSMINPDKPVWDRFVLKNLKLSFAHKVSADERITSAVDLYGKICASFNDFVGSKQAKEWIELFDKQFPEAEGISVVKKIDLILWQMRD